MTRNQQDLIEALTEAAVIAHETRIVPTVPTPTRQTIELCETMLWTLVRSLIIKWK